MTSQSRSADGCRIQRSPKTRNPRRVPEKTFDVSLTIGIPDTDIKDETFDELVTFLDERADMGVLPLEMGDSHLYLQIQGEYMPGFRWLTSSKVSPFRAELIWRACTNPQSVEVADVRNIFFGIDTPARYFKTNTVIKTKFDESEEAAEVEDTDLPAEDEEAEIPVVNLERKEESGADLERVQEALLNVGFAAGRKLEEKNDTNTTLLDIYVYGIELTYLCRSQLLQCRCSALRSHP
ncbi:hypothetical protein R1sor_014944 [Riccia sorocarpa]|uniref:Uncharacterized protein n=1 Tax=Riccia sorocarpa TaxID=122646 RepID=A0ABD3HAU3_9MARC